MIVVNVFTGDNEDGSNAKDHDVTLLVGLDHSDRIQTLTTRFEIAWKQALNKARKADPQGWNVDQVYNYLRNSGWQIIQCRDAAEVAY